MPLNDRVYIDLIDAIYKLNASISVDKIIASRINETEYQLKVRTKTDLKLDYALFFNGSGVGYTITTRKTIWQPRILLLNIAVRKQIIKMIKEYKLQALSVTFS